MNLHLSILLILLASCSTAKKEISQTPVLETVPSHAFESEAPHTVTVAVVGINDFHGHLCGKIRKRQDGSEIVVGGAAALKSYLDILRKEMKGRVLLVDAGDEWQGTLESGIERGKSVVEFFNRVGVSGAAIGNHEFDFGPSDLKDTDLRGVLKQRMNEAQYPYLASNIYEKKSKRRVKWPNSVPSQIYSVDGIRIAVIGASTQDTPATTRADHVQDLEFREPSRDILREANYQKTRGANAVLLTTHAGTLCTSDGEIGGALTTWALRSNRTASGSCAADQEINQVLKKIPAGTLQGVIAGHTHQIVHHWIEGVPTIEGEAYNKYFNILYLTFDRETGRNLPELTRIEGPIPICERMFIGKNHCDPERILDGQDPGLTEAQFHGYTVHPDAEVQKWVGSVVERVSETAKRELGSAARTIHHSRFEESEFLNLLADTVRERLKTDFSIFGNGGIRTSLDPGSITYEKIYAAMPFDNRPVRMLLSGAEIKRLLEISTSGRGGYAGVSGLVLTLIRPDEKGEERDLNQDGKSENWETKRLVSVQTTAGEELSDKKFYTVATDNYLSTGGDRWEFITKTIPAKRSAVIDGANTRELVVQKIELLRVINSMEAPLIDPEHPRLKFRIEK